MKRARSDDHAGSISGVSVGPVIAYDPPKITDALLMEWSSFGAAPVDPRSATDTGISMIHLSHEFDAKSAEVASLELSRRYMDADAYFGLKSFSYCPRDYTRQDFDRDVAESGASQLLFRLSTGQALYMPGWCPDAIVDVFRRHPPEAKPDFVVIDVKTACSRVSIIGQVGFVAFLGCINDFQLRAATLCRGERTRAA